MADLQLKNILYDLNKEVNKDASIRVFKGLNKSITHNVNGDSSITIPEVITFFMKFYIKSLHK